MMYRKKSSRPTMLKALFVLPVTAITLCAFATPEVQEAVEAIDKADPTAAVVNKMMAPMAEALTPDASAMPADVSAAVANLDLVREKDGEPVDTASFAYAHLAKVLNEFRPDDNTLFMIDTDVLSYSEFLDRARRITGNHLSGIATYNDVPLPESDYGYVAEAKNYKRAFCVRTQDYYSLKHAVSKADEIFTMPDVEAQYPGGEAALMMQLAKTLRYPVYAQKNNLTGHVILKFVVEKDGSIGPIKVLQSLEERCDAEAILAVSKLGNFTPAKHQGQPVRSYLTLPVSFRLN